MSTLAEAMTRFAERYHERAELVAQQRDWSRTIVLIASDSGAAVTVSIEEGRITHVDEATRSADLIVTAAQALLCDILELRRGPNEPYLFGELTVRGAEADFVRLDYITEALCPN